MCSGLGGPMSSPVEKVTTTSTQRIPKRKTVLRKYVEKSASEDENSNSMGSHDTPSVSFTGPTGSPPTEQVEIVEVQPAVPVSALPDELSRVTLLDQPTATYEDPLQDVLTSSRNGSQIWLSDADQRRLSTASDQGITLPVPQNGHVVETSGTAAAGTESTPVLNGHGNLARRKSFMEDTAATLNEWKNLVPSKAQNVDQLFGLGELNKHLPNHRLRIFVGTWNVNGQATFGNLRDFLFPRDSIATQLCDLYAVGIQEGLPEFKNWEINLQKTIGLTHILFASEAVGTIHISIFIRRELIWFCTKPLISRYHLRLINSKNSKGFVGAFFCLFGSSVMVMTSHLTAGHSAESLDVRIAQLNRIYRELVIPRSLEQTRGLANRFDAVDYVFWFGDFNFRLTETRATVENTISEISSVQVEDNGEHLQKLLGWDQLHRHKVTSIVHDFNEHPISFLPTYKYDLNSDHYDRSSKQRTPSYTDRILFRSNGPGNPIVCRCYQAASDVKSSDHRPVYGVFDLKIRPQVRALPDAELNAGLFNRDVFTSAVGQLRREQALMKAAVGRTAKASTVCSIL